MERQRGCGGSKEDKTKSLDKSGVKIMVAEELESLVTNAEVEPVGKSEVGVARKTVKRRQPKPGKGLVSRLQVTARDIEILRFINEFGFCEMPHLDKRFGWNKPRNYQVIERLLRMELLRHERVFYGRPGIYRLTQKGASYTDLPAMRCVPLGNYVHEVTLIDVYLQLRFLYPEARFISERQLKRDKFFDGVGQRGHLSDGFLIFPEGKQVAIEVELSLKGRNRTESILKGYGGEFSIEEVWYYCPEGIASSLRSMAAKMPFIKVYDLREFLG
jgi:hypothetical protein